MQSFSDHAVLEVRGVSAKVTNGRIQLLIDVRSWIERGEVVGLRGQPGSGQSILARSVQRSLADGIASSGEFLLDGEDLSRTAASRLRRVRPRSLGVIFQDARQAVDPLWTIEDHLTEGMRVHGRMIRSEARKRTVNLLHQVG